MKATVHITLRPDVLDPQGKAIAGALQGLGYTEVAGARQGKVIELDLYEAPSAESARERVEAMCRQLLANPVIEDYRIDLSE